MVRNFELNETLAGSPSLRAIKAFLAAAKFRSFTGAAHALSVTPAAVSKQVRELEDYLGAELFVRAGRTVTLTADGEMFKDASQLSLINILQAANRLRKKMPGRQTLVVSCSPTFSALWLHPRLPDFLQAHPDVELTVLATQNFVEMEAGVQPDVVIARQTGTREGYDSAPLLDEVIYPVCTPQYLQSMGTVAGPGDLLQHALLDLSAYGRSQISEHIDWKVWLALHDVDTVWRSGVPRQLYTSNDYPAIVQLALAHQGVALGWHHLVSPLMASGALVRPLPAPYVVQNRGAHLSVRHDKAAHPVCQQFCQWVRALVLQQKVEEPPA